ncbi:MAG: LysR family transcriptional regulator [Deltaproteobacteria bacterium]|nr:LysR family transcriptional regulator [Deltaproteobacteria bacterium]MBW2017164.1 LysR family transcriptional regulator [Deltaproteobacteria bacterium]MBW2129890.1 LysR family transcriptional regulator [Deltaproteobacteria bacterium]MBW2304972.1 LysR family transcriptional regulator [Deltaproteobacteria bacterium]
MTSFYLRSRHWLVNENDKIIMGEGRKEIFENIEKTGSINRTAQIMKMSYKAVWSKIKATENAMGAKLVETNRKQGSHLTRQGKELLESYREMQKKCLKSDDRIFKSVFD